MWSGHRTSGFVFLIFVKVAAWNPFFCLEGMFLCFFFSLWCSICVALVQQAKRSWQMLTDVGSRPVFSPFLLSCLRFPFPHARPLSLSLSLCLCQPSLTIFSNKLWQHSSFQNCYWNSTTVFYPFYNNFCDLYCTACVPVLGKVITSSHLGVKYAGNKETVSYFRSFNWENCIKSD